MLLAACRLLLAPFYHDKRGPEASSKTPQIRLEDDIYFQLLIRINNYYYHA